MNNYAKEWRLAGYPEGMGSESFLPAPPRGFIRVYHFTSPNHVTRSIEHSRLKVARFSDTNDPFELMGLMLREKGIRQAVRDFKKRCNNDVGLLCFSTNWDNPLLWSHYAAGHTGVCFGFDLKEGMARRVLYEEKRLMAIVDNKNRGRFVIDDDLKQRLLLTKSHHWIYEDELRVLINLPTATKEGDLYFRTFDKDLRLAEVILGPRCSLKVETLRNVAKSTNPCAIVFRSRLEFGEFRVIRNGRDLPSIAEALEDRPSRCN